MELAGLQQLTGIDNPASGKASAYVFVNAEASALAARFTNAPSNGRKLLIDNLFTVLKSIGLAKFDALYVRAAADKQASQRNWIADAYNLSEGAGVMAFTADRGVTPDGVTTYEDTGFNPTTAPTPKFTLNDAHMGAWHLTDLANAGGTSFDVGNGNSRFTNSATAQTGVRPNNVTTVTVVDNFAKHKVWTRSAAGVWEYYNSGADTGGGADASTALAATTFNIGRTGAGSMGVNQCAIYHFGANLTAGEVATLYAGFNAYMQAVGAA